MADEVFVHAAAINESETVGAGTRIWAFAHVMRGAVVGRGCNIGDHAFVEAGAVIGNGVTLKNGVAVWEGVTIEDFAFVGPGAIFTNDRYPRSPRAPQAQTRYADRGWLDKTLVREGATIGAGAIIVCGTTIGRHAMVAAGAVVTRDVAEYQLVSGAPARPTGYVCACGHPFPGKVARCSRCGRTYRRDGDGLAPTRPKEVAP